MDRRSFLALLASAPIAALAPLPKLLPTPQRLPFGHSSCGCKICSLMRQYYTGKVSEMAGFDWFSQPYGDVYARSANTYN